MIVFGPLIVYKFLFLSVFTFLRASLHSKQDRKRKREGIVSAWALPTPDSPKALPATSACVQLNRLLLHAFPLLQFYMSLFGYLIRPRLKRGFVARGCAHIAEAGFVRYARATKLFLELFTALIRNFLTPLSKRMLERTFQFRKAVRVL